MTSKHVLQTRVNLIITALQTHVTYTVSHASLSWFFWTRRMPR